jgi:hypothetical protein
MLKTTILSLCILLAFASHSQSFRVVPNSLLAKIAGKLKGEEEDYAVTIGKTIYLSCNKEYFFSDTPWVRHEVTHVEQYKKYGILEFAKRYLFFSIFFHSYNKIPFEREAIFAEKHNN